MVIPLTEPAGAVVVAGVVVQVVGVAVAGVAGAADGF